MIMPEQTFRREYDQPVFVCGYPKSGTTLLISLLDGHPDLLVIPEETKFFSKVYPRNPGDQFDALFTDTNIAAIQRGIVDEPSGMRDYRHIDFNALRASAKAYWSQSGQTPQALLEGLAHGLSETTSQKRFLRWVEKTPRTENHLSIVSEWWPKLSAVFMIRDPRQTFCSHREYQKRRPNPSKITLDTFLPRWKNSVTNFEKYVTSGGSGLIVRYEDLCAEPARVMGDVADLLNIPFQNRLVSPSRAGQQWTGNAASGTEFHAVSSRPPNWPEKLTHAEVEAIEAALASIMKRFGYELTTKFPQMRGAAYAGKAFIINRVRCLLHRAMTR
jgi:protein-tyrosine sulfotransferase